MDLSQLSDEEIAAGIKGLEELRASRDTYDLAPCHYDRLKALYRARESRTEMYLRGTDGVDLTFS